MDKHIKSLIEKYAEILGVSRDQLPIVKIRDNLGSKWLGRCTWSANANSNTTLIELQKSITNHDRTLERIIAHEMIHHYEFITMTDREKALIKMGIKPDSHGPGFVELAAKINALTEPNFVTKTSDQDFVKDIGERKFHLLIYPVISAPTRWQLGYAWAARPSTKVLAWAKIKIAQGAKMIVTYDVRWTKGPKMKVYGGFAVPKIGSEDADLLIQLYDQA